jgi:hypothetical protein
VETAIFRDFAQEMSGNGLEFVIGEMRQMFAGEADGAVPGIGELQAEKGEFVEDESTVKGGVMGYKWGVCEEFEKPGERF